VVHQGYLGEGIMDLAAACLVVQEHIRSLLFVGVVVGVVVVKASTSTKSTLGE
jgi:hypothetical protein